MAQIQAQYERSLLSQLAHYECFAVTCSRRLTGSTHWWPARSDTTALLWRALLLAPSPARGGRCPMDGRRGARHTHGSLCRLDHTSTRCSCKCAAVHLPDTTAEVGLSYCTARKRVLIRTRSFCEPSELDDSCTRHVRTAPNFTCPDGLSSALSLSHTAANQNDPSI